MSNARWLRNTLLITCITMPAAALGQSELRVSGEGDPIKVFAPVTTTNGVLIPDLTQQAFQLFEDDNAQTVSLFQPPGTSPARIVFVMDYSGSMPDVAIVSMENAVNYFISNMHGDDQAAIVKFKGEARAVQTLTNDKQALLSAMDIDFKGGSGTKLYEAINEAINVLLNSNLTDHSPALIVLSDGEDVGSDLTLHQLTTNIDAANIPIFTIGYGNNLKKDILRQVAVATGGWYTETSDSEQFTNIYQGIQTRLDVEYMLGYYTAITDCDTHTLKVVVDTPAGQKDYAGTFTRCFPEINTPTNPGNAPKGSGGGNVSILDIAWLILAACITNLRGITATRRARQPLSSMITDTGK